MKVRGFEPRQREPGGSARKLTGQLSDGMRRRVEDSKATLAQPFKGITTDGAVTPDLFRISEANLDTSEIKDATVTFLNSLDARARGSTTFDLDAKEWRQWSNIHPFLFRHGSMLEELTTAQRHAALAIAQATLSESGFRTARDVMRLNDAIGEITGRREEYGEWVYWMSVMGTPSDTEPWGWQVDGHHLIINCFLLGGQIVTTPMFMGSEPVAIETGKHAGTRVFEQEESNALHLLRSLDSGQRKKAVLSDDLPGDVFTSAFRDNFELQYDGLSYQDLSSPQQTLLLNLTETYINRTRTDQARVKMDEVKQHLDETYFAWMGSPTSDDSVFYYRIHSPVVLIEFDHQRGVALADDVPTRNHIHTIIRTPNGNDYGKDLLRQHRQQSDHSLQ